MDSLSHWLRSPHPVLTLVVLALVTLLLLSEYAFDWPVHLRRDAR